VAIFAEVRLDLGYPELCLSAATAGVCIRKLSPFTEVSIADLAIISAQQAQQQGIPHLREYSQTRHKNLALYAELRK
jgi:hypothetical protein